MDNCAKERNFKDYQRLIYMAVHKFSNLPVLDPTIFSFEDLCSEGSVVFVELCRYEAEYGLDCAFTTALMKRLEHRFINLFNYNKRYLRKATEKMEYIDEAYKAETYYHGRTVTAEDVSCLSDEAKQVLEVFFNAPKEYVDIVSAQFRFTAGIRELLKALGCSEGAAWRSLRDWFPDLYNKPAHSAKVNPFSTRVRKKKLIPFTTRVGSAAT